MIATRFNPIGRNLGFSARKYLQDGLVAHWDAIENAGYGVHNANASSWRSLVGDYNINFFGNDFLFNDENFEISNVNTTYAECDSQDFVDMIINGVMTIEVGFIRPGYAYPSSDDDDIGVICISSPPSITTNRMLCFDSRSSFRALGVLQFRQQGWVNDSVRIPPSLGINFGKKSIYSILCNGNTATITNVANGKKFTSVSPQGRSDTSARLGLNTYYSGEADWNGVPTARWHFIRVYNKARSPEETAHDFALDKERFGIE